MILAVMILLGLIAFTVLDVYTAIQVANTLGMHVGLSITISVVLTLVAVFCTRMKGNKK